jgi:hypothetical protein
VALAEVRPLFLPKRETHSVRSAVQIMTTSLSLERDSAVLIVMQNLPVALVADFVLEADAEEYANEHTTADFTLEVVEHPLDDLAFRWLVNLKREGRRVMDNFLSLKEIEPLEEETWLFLNDFQEEDFRTEVGRQIQSKEDERWALIRNSTPIL